MQTNTLTHYAQTLGTQAKTASARMASASAATKNIALRTLARAHWRFAMIFESRPSLCVTPVLLNRFNFAR